MHLYVYILCIYISCLVFSFKFRFSQFNCRLSSLLFLKHYLSYVDSEKRVVFACLVILECGTVVLHVQFAFCKCHSFNLKYGMKQPQKFRTSSISNITLMNILISYSCLNMYMNHIFVESLVYVNTWMKIVLWFVFILLVVCLEFSKSLSINYCIFFKVSIFFYLIKKISNELDHTLFVIVQCSQYCEHQAMRSNFI